MIKKINSKAYHISKIKSKFVLSLIVRFDDLSSVLRINK